MNKPLIIGITTVALAGAAFVTVSQTTQDAAAQTTTSSFNQSMTQMMQDIRSGNTTAATKDYNQAYASMTKIMNNHLQNSAWVSSMTARMATDKAQLSSMMSGSYAGNGTYGSMMGTYGSSTASSNNTQTSGYGSMRNGSSTTTNGTGTMMNGSGNYSNGSSMMGGSSTTTGGMMGGN